MKLSHLLLAVLTLAFFITGTISPATAGSMGNGAAQRMKLVVQSINTTSGSITIKSGVDQTVHTYKIDATTHVKIINTNGTPDQIQAGMKVNLLLAGHQAPKEGDTLTFIGVSPAAP